MKNPAVAEVTVRNASWQFEGAVKGSDSPGSLQVDVPYALIGNDPDKLLLTGLGEKDVIGIAGRLAERGVGGLAVASVVYPERAKLNEDAVEQSIVEGTAAVVRDIAGEGASLRRGIGNSAGGGQVMLAAYHRPELFEHVTAVAPGPLNVKALGKDYKRQAKQLLNRFAEAGLTDIMTAADNQAGYMEIMREARAGLIYANAAKVDNAAILNALRGRLDIRVGERDEVTPAREYAAMADGLITTIPDMGHSILITDAGCERMAEIIETTEPNTQTVIAATAKTAKPIVITRVAPQPAT